MYTLGSLKNEKDLRDIHISQVQTPVSVPNEYFTDISWIPVFNQGNLGSCVGHAHAILHIYNEYKENGKIPKLSPRYIYALSKKIDGYAGEGTFPRISAKIEVERGCATENTVLNDTTLSHAEYVKIGETSDIENDAKPYRMKGYASVSNDAQSLKQAIIQNGLVATSISVGGYTNPMTKGNIGLHRIILYGYLNVTEKDSLDLKNGLITLEDLKKKYVK